MTGDVPVRMRSRSSRHRVVMRDLLGNDLARSEKFSTSLKDGLDIRETLRNWHTGDLFVKVCHDELVGMKFLKANIYRRYNHFDKAIPIFNDILDKHRSHETAEFSANLLLDTYNRLQRYDDMIAQVHDALAGPQGAAFADVNNDSRPDLFIAKGNVDQMPDFAARDPNNLLLLREDCRGVRRSARSDQRLPGQGDREEPQSGRRPHVAPRPPAPGIAQAHPGRGDRRHHHDPAPEDGEDDAGIHDSGDGRRTKDD